MGLDAGQVVRWVIEPVLARLDPEIPHTDAAAMVLLLTAAHESRLSWLDQLSPGPGPAYGLWQMEARTLADHHRWLSQHPALGSRIAELMTVWPETPLQLQGNLYYACAMARVHYWRAPEALPSPSDLDGIAALWKLRYNTVAGKGTPAQFKTSARAIGYPFSIAA